ncbi:DUF2202 domain-containing protein [Zoogloea sp.]|uniref:DUF2202 domain-containing protein n=1 Tax=Zoogloea sp. TaxID=49181 RepID=UPI0035B4124C
MKQTLRKIAVAALGAGLLAACGGGGDGTPQGGPPFTVSADGSSAFAAAALGSTLAALPVEALSAAEAASLAYMREEEKLAYDVYSRLDAMWGRQLPIFANIAQSEATHTEAVRQLLVRYTLTDPAANLSAGLFTVPVLQQLYHDLVAQGATSLIAALQVGATIEEIDIVDLETALPTIDNQDIRLVYGNLLKGSRNHLRAFVQALAQQGVTYTPAYLTTDTYSAIVTTAFER